MTETLIRQDGRAGRITLNRPDALNALTHDMCLAIETALDNWRDDPSIALLVIDGAGDRAFCAGGDIAQLYATGRAGNANFGRQFWRDEYRMNAKLFEFPKPVVSFLHGFTMGGGVGVGCHGSHRIVCDNSRIAMPECGIGLVPDVGGSLILGRAPGRLGEYLGVTGDRMDASDAIHAGFADYYIPQPTWETLKTTLCQTGDLHAVDAAALPPPPSRLASWQADIDATFGGERLGDCIRSFARHPSAAVTLATTAIRRNSPLSMCVTIDLIHRVRARDSIRYALEMEYRFTHRALDQSDILEGIRAAIIDKDKSPKWRHSGWDAVPGRDVMAMLQPITDAKLIFERDPT